MKRRDFIALLGGAAAWPLAARAQQAEPVRRVGALIGGAKDSPFSQSVIAALRERLAMLGWVEGGNLRMDYRFIGGDPSSAPAYAAELVNLRPDLIFALAGAAARAAQQRTPVEAVEHPAKCPGKALDPTASLVARRSDFGTGSTSDRLSMQEAAASRA